jgi:hypothetical protein
MPTLKLMYLILDGNPSNNELIFWLYESGVDITNFINVAATGSWGIPKSLLVP